MAAVIATAAGYCCYCCYYIAAAIAVVIAAAVDLVDVAATDTPMSVHLHVFVHHFLDCVVVTNHCDARFSLYRNVVLNQLLK